MVDWERVQLIIAEQPTVDEQPAQLSEDQRYQRALEQIQQGQPEEALPLLHALQTAYPSAQMLGQLLDEVQIRAEVKQVWDGKIQGRRPQFLSKRLRIYLIGLPLVLVLLISSVSFYQTAHSHAQRTQQIQHWLQQGQTALAHGDDRTAANFFRQALTMDRGQAAAQEGYRTAMRHLQVESEYNAGLQALRRKDFANALAIFTQIQQEAPNYRDVERLLMQIPTNKEE